MEAFEKRDQWTVRVILVLLVLYNVLFFVCDIFPDQTQGTLQNMYKVVLNNRAMIGFLEFLGVAVLFVDLIVGWDKKSKSAKYVSLLLVALVAIAFVLKIFLTYLKAFHESGAQA